MGTNTRLLIKGSKIILKFILIMFLTTCAFPLVVMLKAYYDNSYISVKYIFFDSNVLVVNLVFILTSIITLYIFKENYLKLDAKIEIETDMLTITKTEYKYISYWNIFNFKSKPIINVYNNINSLDFLSVFVFENSEYHDKILDEKGNKIIFGYNDINNCIILINKNEGNRNYIYLDDLGLDVLKSDIIKKAKVVFGEDKVSVNGISKELDNI